MKDKNNDKLQIGNIELGEDGKIWEWNGDAFVENYDFRVVVDFILYKDKYINNYVKTMCELSKTINYNKSEKTKIKDKNKLI